ncbi:MAG: hypothetical protein PHY44_07545 [Lachnospiraceae bacterium]|nr:hypothetical protein [Lachnospiraceae bacterium]
MMKGKLKAMGLPIGGPSILMAFILLCLTIFACISFMAANRDYKLSQKTAESLTQYYVADNKAEEILAEIDDSLKNNEEIESIESNLKDYKTIITKEGNVMNISYAVAVKDEMELAVSAKFTEGKVEILGWKVVNNRVIEDTPTFLDLPVF